LFIDFSRRLIGVKGDMDDARKQAGEVDDDPLG
jgi:hypothetical protein